MPLRKIGPNPKTNPKPNPNPNREAVFLECNCLVAPNSKTNPDLDSNPNPNREVVFLGEQLSGYHKRFYLKNEIRNFQHQNHNKIKKLLVLCLFTGFAVIIFVRAHCQELGSKKFLNKFLELKTPEI